MNFIIDFQEERKRKEQTPDLIISKVHILSYINISEWTPQSTVCQNLIISLFSFLVVYDEWKVGFHEITYSYYNCTLLFLSYL